MHEIKVFIAYQFRSFDRSEIETLIIEACQRAQDDLNRECREQAIIHPALLDLLSGESSSAQVLARVADANLCVFEISDLSPEVFFGVGYALGRGKPCIYLQSEEQAALGTRVDLPGVLILRYNAETLSGKLAYELYRQASEIIDKRILEYNQRAIRNEERDTLRAFWGLENEHIIYLVCPEIPEEDRIAFADPSARDYLRLGKFADIETLFLLKAFLARYFPELQIFECTCNDMPYEANAANFISIGGIAWNKLTAQVTQGINLPFIQRDGGPGNPDPIDDIRNGSSYLPTMSENGTVREDIGYFVKIPNPANREKLLFVVNGIFTHGVLGAAKCFTEGIQAVQNCSYIMQRMGKNPYFVALLRIPVLNNYVGVPNITKRGILIELLGYSPERNEFT